MVYVRPWVNKKILFRKVMIMMMMMMMIMIMVMTVMMIMIMMCFLDTKEPLT